MSPFWGHLAGVVSLILMITFIGIWVWVWNARHKPKYDALARLPMGDALARSESTGAWESER
mgnify:CR=1 FL=1|jgi:cytochrome c oxidase cbb3-type subunit 4